MQFQAVKAVYDRKSKTYRVEWTDQGDPIMCHDGWYVFDSVDSAIKGIESGYMLSHLDTKKRSAVLAYLRELRSN